MAPSETCCAECPGGKEDHSEHMRRGHPHPKEAQGFLGPCKELAYTATHHPMPGERKRTLGKSVSTSSASPSALRSSSCSASSRWLNNT